LKKNTVWVAAGLAVIFAVVLAVFTFGRPEGGTTENSGLQQAVHGKEEPQQQETVPEEIKAFAEYAVNKELGTQTGNYKERIRSIDVITTDGRSDITIELNGNDGYTKEMTVRGFLMDTKKLLQQFSTREDIAKVTITEYLEVEDLDGSLMDEWASTMVITKDNMDKFINENLNLTELPGLTLEYKLHPNLK